MKARQVGLFRHRLQVNGFLVIAVDEPLGGGDTLVKIVADVHGYLRFGLKPGQKKTQAVFFNKYNQLSQSSTLSLRCLAENRIS